MALTHILYYFYGFLVVMMHFLFLTHHMLEEEVDATQHICRK